MVNRKYNNRFFNSLIWDKFVYREDDIVVASYAKSGTTLLQQIIAQLVFNGDEAVKVSEVSPWLDSVYPSEAEKLALLSSQSHRRFIKTHLPADYVAFSNTAKYIYIIRDGRDIAGSLYRHQCAISESAQQAIEVKNQSDKKLKVIEAPEDTIVDYFAQWLEKDGYPFWPFWENVRSWWAKRNEPNVLLLHFDVLTNNLDETIQKIADFLGFNANDELMSKVIAHSQFEYMKENAERYVPEDVALWKDGGKAFFHQGKSGRWRKELSAALNDQYIRKAKDELGDDCAQWLLHTQGSQFS